MKKVGIALGGGSAHGVAHLGILQVFIENKIPIDFICGCSAGAVAGAMYATGSDMYLAGKLCASVDMSAFIDVTIPHYGFVKGQKAEELLNMLTKGKSFEDLTYPKLSVVACDMLKGVCISLSSGNIARACHASFAIPGVFEPIEMDDMLLIDGGVITRIPVKQVREMGAEYVIGVDVGYQGWGHERPKNIMEIMMNAFDMSDWQNTSRVYQECDIMINPDLREIPMNNLSKAEECVQLGREAALCVVEKIKKDIGM